MKIIKLPTKYVKKDKKTLDGMKCPFCKEHKDYWGHWSCGIESYTIYSYRRRLFSSKIIRQSIDKYICHNCGAEWEENKKTLPFNLEEENNDT